jgi:hypothetical protein
MISEENILDIAHIGFLDMIKIMITLSGGRQRQGHVDPQCPEDS